jgi:hydrogenase small subunit
LAQTVAAVGKAKKPVLVWLQFQDCTGCSESILRSNHPERRRRAANPFLFS